MLYTQATPTVDNINKKVILTDKNDSSKKVVVEFLCSHKFEIITGAAKPLDGTPTVEGQRENLGFYRVASKTTGSGNVCITVKITPMGIASTDIQLYNVPIDEWTINTTSSDFQKITVCPSDAKKDTVGIFAHYAEDGKLICASLTHLSAKDEAVSVKNPFVPEVGNMLSL